MDKGRKPSSKNFRLIAGTAVDDAPDTVTENTPDKTAKRQVTVKAPSWIKGAIARREYERVATELARQNKWSPLFVTPIGLYADTFQQYRWAREQISKGDLTTKSPNGYPIQNPMLAIANKAHEQMIKISAEFGFTLTSAVRVASAQLDLFDSSQPSKRDAAAEDNEYAGL